MYRVWIVRFLKLHDLCIQLFYRCVIVAEIFCEGNGNSFHINCLRTWQFTKRCLTTTGWPVTCCVSYFSISKTKWTQRWNQHMQSANTGLLVAWRIFGLAEKKQGNFCGRKNNFGGIFRDYWRTLPEPILPLLNCF